jgi:hypothetical protein
MPLTQDGEEQNQLLPVNVPDLRVYGLPEAIPASDVSCFPDGLS